MAEASPQKPTKDATRGLSGAAKEPTGAGSLRAAAVLLGLGADVAAEVFRMLDETEVRRIAAGARELRKAQPELLTDALKDFVTAMEGVSGDLVLGDNMLRGAAEAALGPDIARRAFEGVAAPPPPDEVLGPITEADPEALAMVLSREQAQTVALVLSAMTPEKAAAVMAHVPEGQRPGIVRRMATVESVAPEVLREVRHALTSELQAVVAEGMRRVDGKGAALEVLRRASAAQQQEVIASIEKDDPNLAADLRVKLFTFDDFGRLTDRDIQAVLKDADQSQLSMALKGAPDALREKLLRNMSSRAAQMLQDDIAAMGPVRLAVVEQAQATMTRLALELAEKGKITIIRATDKLV
ncbi:MAG: flagellar motor switch protein FliG [Myxococcaceae bacterium]|nr:flagellar motor switch protein FliG [Myxococcaceae bacterium]